MSNDVWQTKKLLVARLNLDAKNPRIGADALSKSPRDLIQYLFDHDKAIEIAHSIAVNGFFINEPLLAIHEGNKLIVIEGNRRLAALKALNQPAIIEGPLNRQVERLSRQILSPDLIKKVPVTIAPNRRSTDRQIAIRHIGTPVLAWQAENRASFILEKISEGYDNNELKDDLGFSLADIQQARQIKAIADMARSIDLPTDVKKKVENPRAKIFSTVERVFDSSVGRDFFKIQSDPTHGFIIKTSKEQFVNAYIKLLSDIVKGNQSSRSLNTNENIADYFNKWNPSDKPSVKNNICTPDEIIQSKKTTLKKPSSDHKIDIKTKKVMTTIIPKDFKIKYGDERLLDLRKELIKLKRKEFPNAGAILLRVFLELSILHYLKRTGELEDIITRIQKSSGKMLYDVPSMKQLVPEINRIAKARLSQSESERVQKAVKYDDAAPFTISDLNKFVHSPDLPSERDILQFWSRTEPLFKLMLQNDCEE